MKISKRELKELVSIGDTDTTTDFQDALDALTNIEKVLIARIGIEIGVDRRDWKSGFEGMRETFDRLTKISTAIKLITEIRES